MAALTVLQKIAVWVIPVLLAITVHEVAHGYVARLRGDSTAASLGRLTLNPLRHVDPIGTILVPAALLLMSSGFLFGWAKPVPVNWRNLRDPRRDMALVAVAGPAVNLLMALAWALVTRMALTIDALPLELARPLAYMGIAGAFINVILMVLNLLPLPPLDGGRVAVGLLPVRLASALSRMEPWGLVIIVVLLITGGLGWILGPLLEPVLRMMAVFTGLTWEAFRTVLVIIT